MSLNRLPQEWPMPQEMTWSEIENRLKSQKWQVYPGNERDIVLGTVAGERLVKFGIIDHPRDLMRHAIGTVLKTGVSAYQRIA